MKCRCGNEIANVPDHLSELAEWVCQACTNVIPKSQALPTEIDPYTQHPMELKRRKEDEQADAA